MSKPRPNGAFGKSCTRSGRRAGIFRRQAPIGPYIVDFACKRAQVIFEIDGESHFTETGMTSDLVRTAYLEQRGYRVIRFTNLDALTTTEGVYHAVSVALGALP